MPNALTVAGHQLGQGSWNVCASLQQPKLPRSSRHWRALQTWERRLLVKMFFLLPAAWLVLRLLGFNQARRIAEFELLSDSSNVDPAAIERAQRYAQLTAIAALHGIYKANCLHQSLALCWMLRKQGLPAQMRIGVLQQTQPFQAHAWVELDGVSLGQVVDEYKPFENLKPTRKKTASS